jgi:tetratricopeptide (TPR) repeat protein
MMYLAVREDDIDKAESLVARVGKDYGDSVMFAVAHRDTVTVARLRGEARSARSIGEVSGAADQVGGWLLELPTAESFVRIAAARPEPSGRTSLLLALTQLGQGRWMSADSAFAAAARAPDAPEAPLRRGIAAALPFLALPRAELEAIRADLTAWDPATRPAGGAGPTSDLLPQLRLYALGLVASRLGDAGGALRTAAQLETAAAAPDNLPVVRSFAAAVRADVALAAGRPADALKALEAVRGQVPLDLTSSSSFTEDYPRFLRAEALLATGRDDEARRWLETGFDNTADMIVFQAQASLRLGDLYERKGERQKAIDNYARFLRLWGGCDPRLRPAVEEARTRLARVVAEPGS